MPLNTSKCTYLPIKSSPYTYTISGSVLPTATNERDLGVIVQSNLGVSSQSKKASNAASVYLGLLRRAFGDFKPAIMKTILNAYIRPQLEYAVQAWSPWLKRDIRTLEAVQRRATKMVQGLKNETYEERLQTLSLFSAQYRRLRGDMILLYQIFHQSEHPCKSLLHISDTAQLRGHPFKLAYQQCRLDCRKFSFSLRITHTWNALPRSVVMAPSVTVFKRLLDDHMGNRVFEIT